MQVARGLCLIERFVQALAGLLNHIPFFKDLIISFEGSK